MTVNLSTIEEAVSDQARLRELFAELEVNPEIDPLAREVMMGRIERYLDSSGRVTVTGTKDFDPRQPRDSHGRWTEVPGDAPLDLRDALPEGASPDVELGARIVGDAIASVLPKIPDEAVRHVQVVSGDCGGDSGNYLTGTITIDPEVEDLYDSVTIAHEFGHSLEGDGRVPWTRVADVAEGSPEVRELQGVAADDRPGARTAEYMSRSGEVFARAFAQYLALRADGDLRADFELERQDMNSGYYTLGQDWYWTDEHFKPIAAAFDKMFAEKGWR